MRWRSPSLRTSSLTFESLSLHMWNVEYCSVSHAMARCPPGDWMLLGYRGRLRVHYCSWIIKWEKVESFSENSSVIPGWLNRYIFYTNSTKETVHFISLRHIGLAEQFFKLTVACQMSTQTHTTVPNEAVSKRTVGIADDLSWIRCNLHLSFDQHYQADTGS